MLPFVVSQPVRVVIFSATVPVKSVVLKRTMRGRATRHLS